MDRQEEAPLCDRLRHWGLVMLAVGVSTGVAAGLLLTVAYVHLGYSGPFKPEDAALLFGCGLTPSLCFAAVGVTGLLIGSITRRNGGDCQPGSSEIVRGILQHLAPEERAQFRDLAMRPLRLFPLFMIPMLLVPCATVLLPLLPAPGLVLDAILGLVLLEVVAVPIVAYRASKREKRWLSGTAYAKTHRIGPKDIPNGSLRLWWRLLRPVSKEDEP